MVTVEIVFLGILQRKVNSRNITIGFSPQNGGLAIREILTKAMEKLPGEKERQKFTQFVFNPQKPDELNKEMAYVLNGRHLRPIKESLDQKISTNQELVIFPPDGGG